ncbi:MAG: CRTAC1 family protein [Planctomycetota bacterium]
MRTSLPVRALLALTCASAAYAVRPFTGDAAPEVSAPYEEPTSTASAQAGHPLRVLDPHGHWTAVDGAKPGRAILPLTTLDDTPVRPGIEPDGTIRIELRNRALLPIHAQAWVHGADEFVAMHERGALVFGDRTLPRSVRAADGAHDVTGSAARRDGVPLGVQTVDVAVPGGAHDALLMFGLPGPPSSGAPTSTLVQLVDAPFERNGALRIDDAARLDALAFVTHRTPDAAPDATVREIDRSDADAGPVELSLELPKTAREALEAGQSVTLVLAFGDAPVAAERAVEASAAGSNAAPVLRLEDVAAEAGLSFVHLEGPAEQLDIRPTMGPGAAFGDVDEDGLLDLVVLQGGGRPECAPLPDRLWLGRADGTFVDATDSSGLGSGDPGMGALLVDVDGDAHLDLYCANRGRDRLFLGRGDGTFAEATALLPAHELWSASVIAGDPDFDGDLDLYITSYLDYDLEKTPDAAELDRYQREDPLEMLPFAFPAERNVFLRNRLVEDGALGFEDATEELGLSDAAGRGMQAVFWDFDLDGDDDLYVANDVSFNVLFRNEGDGTFEDVSFAAGLDDPRGGMGLALGDVEGDGDEDLFLTNWQLEANALYTNSHFQRSARKRRRANFHDATVKAGLGKNTIGRTSWGAELVDLDLDGALDLYVANGYTSPDYESTGICVGQRNMLYRGDGRGRFAEVPHAPSGPFGARSSRGAIAADHDRDGDLDLLVTNNNGPLELLANRSERGGAWLGVRLERATGGNRFGIGARVTVKTPDGAERVAWIRAGRGYLTGNAPEAHFGLGDLGKSANESPALTVEVRWPDGLVSTLGSAPGRWITVRRED